MTLYPAKPSSHSHKAEVDQKCLSFSTLLPYVAYVAFPKCARLTGLNTIRSFYRYNATTESTVSFCSLSLSLPPAPSKSPIYCSLGFRVLCGQSELSHRTFKQKTHPSGSFCKSGASSFRPSRCLKFLQVFLALERICANATSPNNRSLSLKPVSVGVARLDT